MTRVRDSAVASAHAAAARPSQDLAIATQPAETCTAPTATSAFSALSAGADDDGKGSSAPRFATSHGLAASASAVKSACPSPGGPSTLGEF